MEVGWGILGWLACQSSRSTHSTLTETTLSLNKVEGDRDDDKDAPHTLGYRLQKTKPVWWFSPSNQACHRYSLMEQ